MLLKEILQLSDTNAHIYLFKATGNECMNTCKLKTFVFHSLQSLNPGDVARGT